MTNGSFLTEKTWFGYPLTTMQYKNDRKIDELLRQSPIVPIKYITNTNAFLSVEIYYMDGTSKKSVKHSPQLDAFLINMLLKLFRVHRGTFYASRFLRETLPRYSSKTWFGMSQNQKSNSSRKHQVMQEYIANKLFGPSAKTIIHNTKIAIWNTKECRDGVIIVSLKDLLKLMTTLLPAQVKKILMNSWCTDFRAVLMTQPRIRFLSKQGSHVHLTDNTFNYNVPIESLLAMALQESFPSNQLKPFIEYETLNANARRQLAEERDVNLATLAKIPGAPKNLLTALLKKGSRITDVGDVLSHAPPKALREIAQAVKATSLANKRAFDDENRAVLRLMITNGMTEANAIRNVKNGFGKGNRYTYRNVASGKRMYIPKNHLNTLSKRHRGAVPVETLAARVFQHKHNPPAKGYNYHRNVFINENGNRYSGNQQYSLPSSSQTSGYIKTTGQKLQVQAYRSMEKSRREVDEAIFEKFSSRYSDEDFGMEFARECIEAGLKMKGPLKKRPYFLGNTGTPIIPGPGKKMDLSPFDEFRDRQKDGCVEEKEWPGKQGRSLSIHQSVAFGVMNMRAMDKIHLPGYFCYFSVGAGKTVISLSCIISFWNTEKSIFPCSVRSNNKEGSNDLAKLAEEACRYFRWFRSSRVGTVTLKNHSFRFVEYPFAGTVATALEQLKERLKYGHSLAGYSDAKSGLSDKHLLGTYTTTLNLIKKYKYTTNSKPIRNCVFILDEMQFLFDVPLSEQGYKEEYNEFIDILVSRHPSSCFAVGLTATPGDTKADVYRLLGTLLCTPTLTDESFNAMPSIISSSYVTGNPAYFPKVTVKMECVHMPVRHENNAQRSPLHQYYPMYLLSLSEQDYMHSKTQIVKFVEEIGKKPFKPKKSTVNQTNAQALKEAQKFRSWFFKLPKRFSEYLRISKTFQKRANKATEIRNNNNNNNNNGNVNLSEYYKSLNGGDIQHGIIRGKSSNNEFKFMLSPKTMALIRTLKEPGVHFVYIETKQTMRLIAHILSVVYGWKLYDPDKPSSSSPVFGFINPIGQSKTTLYDPFKKMFVPQVEVKNVAKLLRLIQTNDNVDGSKCKVIFATLESYKGVNTKNIRHIHMLSSLGKMTDILQLIGRGTRFKSHCALPRKYRNLIFHIWSLQPPPGVQLVNKKSMKSETMLFPDQFVASHAKEGFQSMKLLMQAIVEKSIDRNIYGDSFDVFDVLYNNIVQLCDPHVTKQKVTNFLL
jgi:hypothetical protein